MQLPSPTREHVRQSYRDLRDRRCAEHLTAFGVIAALAVRSTDAVAAAEARRRIAQVLRWRWDSRPWARDSLVSLRGLLDARSSPPRRSAGWRAWHAATDGALLEEEVRTDPLPDRALLSEFRGALGIPQLRHEAFVRIGGSTSSAGTDGDGLAVHDRAREPRTAGEQTSDTRRVTQRRATVRQLAEQLGVSADDARRALQTLTQVLDLRRVHAVIEVSRSAQFAAALRPGDTVFAGGSRGTILGLDRTGARAMVQMKSGVTRWCRTDALRAVGAAGDAETQTLTECAATLLTEDVLPALAEPARAQLVEALVDGLHETVADKLDGIPREARSTRLRTALDGRRPPEPLPVGPQEHPIHHIDDQMVEAIRDAADHLRRHVESQVPGSTLDDALASYLPPEPPQADTQASPPQPAQATADFGHGVRTSLLTIEDVAQILRVGAAQIDRLVRSGRLPAVRLGSQFHVAAADLRRWVRSRNRRPQSPPEPEQADCGHSIQPVRHIDGVSLCQGCVDALNKPVDHADAQALADRICRRYAVPPVRVEYCQSKGPFGRLGVYHHNAAHIVIYAGGQTVETVLHEVAHHVAASANPAAAHEPSHGAAFLRAFGLLARQWQEFSWHDL